MSDPQADPLPPLVLPEGWHVLHLYYSIDHSQWSILSQEEQRSAKTDLSELVQEIRSHSDGTQLLTFSVATPKADLGFMLLTPDLRDAVSFEKQLTLSLGPDILQPTYSYLSVTERSEYMTTREDYAHNVLQAQQGLTEGTPEYEAGLEEFDTRMKHYEARRLHPVLPDWPVLCFYPMSKRRNPIAEYNWYQQDFETRKDQMKGHATTGRKYAGKILQLITGSTGLDEHEWGVTLLSQSTGDVKDIVYEMRFDEVSARYAEFGDFYIGLQLPLNELFRQVCL